MPAWADAHVRVLPEEAEAGTYTVLRVNVPNESPELATTKVVVEFPPGFGYALYQPVAGWSAEVRVTKPTKSIIDGRSTPARVARVTWIARQPGAEIQPRQFEDFPIAVQIPSQVGKRLTFRALQTYEDGEVVRWVGGPTSQSPAPQILLTAPAAVEDGAAEEDAGDGSDGLAIAALIVGLIGLLAGVAALVRSLQAPRPAAPPAEGASRTTSRAYPRHRRGGRRRGWGRR